MAHKSWRADKPLYIQSVFAVAVLKNLLKLQSFTVVDVISNWRAELNNWGEDFVRCLN